MEHVCHVCTLPVLPDVQGRVRVEGITLQDQPKQWVWGPVVVHEDCRMDVRTPYDDEVGGAYVSTWERIKA
jgi:hypothetical protein